MNNTVITEATERAIAENEALIERNARDQAARAEITNTQGWLVLHDLDDALAQLTGRRNARALTTPAAAANYAVEGRGDDFRYIHTAEFVTTDDLVYTVTQTEECYVWHSHTTVSYDITLLIGTDENGQKHYKSANNAQSHLEALLAKRDFVPAPVAVDAPASKRSRFARLLGR